jgi:hypothetical protein
MKGQIQYTWKCPPWVAQNYCRIKRNKPFVSFEIKNLPKKDEIKYDTLYEIKCDVTINKVIKANFIGFFVIYSQKSLSNYLNFTIYNDTSISYGSDVNFKILFENELPKVIKDNILINWSINSTESVSKNGFNYPDIYFKFQEKLEGMYNLTCTLTYRNGTFAQKTVSRSKLFNLPSPPKIGFLETYPDFLITLTNKKLSLFSSKFSTEEDSTGESFKYQYFYRNVFGEFLRIVNKKNFTNQAVFDLVPITDQVRVGVNYEGDSFVFKDEDLTVSLNNVIDYNKIKDISIIFDVEKAILYLEAYSINLRFHILEKQQANKIALEIINILKEILEKKNDISSKKIIYNNKDKIGTILEAVSFKLLNLNDENIKLFEEIMGIMIKVSFEINKEDYFNEESSNNYLRFYDNLLKLKINSNTLNDIDLTINEIFKDLLTKSFRGVPKGMCKFADLIKVNIMGLTVDNIFLKNDVIYVENLIENKNNALNPVFLENYSKNYELQKSRSEKRKSSALIPKEIINKFSNDFIIIIKQYKNWNNVTSFELRKDSDEWYSLSNDLIEARFINEVRMEKNYSDNISDNYEYFQYIENKTLSTDSQTLILNFTYSHEKIKEGDIILNKTSCIKINNDQEDQIFRYFDLIDYECNTWFDFTNGIIQCECDSSGLYTISYNNQFEYRRKSIQFPQTNDSICTYN